LICFSKEILLEEEDYLENFGVILPDQTREEKEELVEQDRVDEASWQFSSKYFQSEFCSNISTPFLCYWDYWINCIEESQRGYYSKHQRQLNHRLNQKSKILQIKKDEEKTSQKEPYPAE
jgi:hypothetical protein